MWTSAERITSDEFASVTYQQYTLSEKLLYALLCCYIKLEENRQKS